MGIALWKILSTISSFTNRVDNMEESHKVLNERVMRMELRHETNEAKINDIHVAVARLEGKIDYLRKEVK